MIAFELIESDRKGVKAVDRGECGKLEQVQNRFEGFAVAKKRKVVDLSVCSFCPSHRCWLSQPRVSAWRAGSSIDR
jgi:hypothetical protein